MANRILLRSGQGVEVSSGSTGDAGGKKTHTSFAASLLGMQETALCTALCKKTVIRKGSTRPGGATSAEEVFQTDRTETQARSAQEALLTLHESTDLPSKLISYWLQGSVY